MADRAVLAGVCVLALAGAATCWRATTATAEPATTKRRLSATASLPRPGAIAITAYMAGKQALVGWHAPSDESPSLDAHGRPMLVLWTINRHESLAMPVTNDDGGFSAIDLDRAAHLLRSYAGEEHPIDPRTLGLIYRIQRHFGVPQVRVVSGYRVPKPGSRSNHGKGRAMDLIVPGVADEEVARFTRQQGFTGVGVYPASQFVHVDIRPRSYFWVDTSGPHMKNRERGILGDLASRSDADAVARGLTPIEPFVLSTDVSAVLAARVGASPSPPPQPQTPQEEDEEDDTP